MFPLLLTFAFNVSKFICHSQMLTSIKVEKLVISAIPDLVETWTKGFGFKPIDDIERQRLKGINLMVFPGTVLLEKPLHGKVKIEGIFVRCILSVCNC